MVKRQEIYMKTMAHIDEVNKSQTDYTLKGTKFADWTEEEM